MQTNASQLRVLGNGFKYTHARDGMQASCARLHRQPAAKTPDYKLNRPLIRLPALRYGPLNGQHHLESGLERRRSHLAVVTVGESLPGHAEAFVLSALQDGGKAIHVRERRVILADLQLSCREIQPRGELLMLPRVLAFQLEQEAVCGRA